MEPVLFCPNPNCENHHYPATVHWFDRYGYHQTRTFGRVPRFKCRSCGRTFSRQTFSIDYYAKRIVDYRDLLIRHANSESLRGITRALGLSCATVQNRFDRLARQAAAFHARMRPLADPREDICIDGLVTYDVSKYFPNEITVSITAGSLFILDLSHATRRRSGSMTREQARRAANIYPRAHFERGGIGRTFADILSSLEHERPPAEDRPLVLITDEKREYVEVLRRSRLWREQDETHRVAHVRISSKLPRTYWNPLFPSNYLDREIRKDQANHRRETTCFSRNASNAMGRFLCYCFYHNYMKRFRIKSAASDDRVHAELAGIERGIVEHSVAEAFSRRVFLSRIRLSGFLARIWNKRIMTPLKNATDYLPAFASA